MNIRTQWSCLINAQGDISEWEDKAGAEYLADLTQVCRYGRALLYSKQNSLTFYYCLPDAEWLEITLQRCRDFALVQAQCQTLPLELSKREFELLTLISSGLTNEEIAEQLNISKRTVAKHIENIFAKTQTESRTGLAMMAVAEHWICLPSPGKLTASALASYEIERIAAKLEAEPPQTGTEKNAFSIKTGHGRPIMIGVPYVQSGIGAIDTKELLNGTRLAVENINRQGGINGRKLQIVTAGFEVVDKNSILKAYDQLLERDVDAISTGHACYLPEVHELIATQGIPYLHIATHSGSDKLAHNLPNKRIDNIFQVCASDVTYGSGISRFLQYYRHYYSDFVQNRCVFVVTVKWQKIDIGIENLIVTLREQHWCVEYIELERPEGAYDHLMTQVHNLSPSMIVLASYFAEDIVNFHQTFIRQPTNAILYSIYAPSAFLPHEQPCEGVLWSTTSGLSHNYLGKRFAQSYEQLFGRQPTYSQASIAYDQANILANAWRNNVSPRHFKMVTDTIRALPYHGVNGTYYFNTDAQIGLSYPDNTKDLSISLPHLIYQVQQGRSAVIAPELFADSRFELPPWFSLKN